jgi:hypothetical protein
MFTLDLTEDERELLRAAIDSYIAQDDDVRDAVCGDPIFETFTALLDFNAGLDVNVQILQGIRSRLDEG